MKLLWMNQRHKRHIKQTNCALNETNGWFYAPYKLFFIFGSTYKTEDDESILS